MGQPTDNGLLALKIKDKGLIIKEPIGCREINVVFFKVISLQI